MTNDEGDELNENTFLVAVMRDPEQERKVKVSGRVNRYLYSPSPTNSLKVEKGHTQQTENWIGKI